MNEVYLHVDLDAFFASVEQLDNPELRGKPVIVGGLPGDRRSVVSTASYEARKYGVHSAMPIVKAYQLCPNGIYLRGRMKRYQEKSQEVMAIFHQYSPDVVQISVDEAFIDLTGTERLLGTPHDVAVRLKKQVKEETGLTVSVGLASTMYIAKIASGYKKPDGLTIVPEGKEADFMLTLPLEKVWGVGSKTLDHLHRAGFKTTKSIYNKSEPLLQSIFGENTGSFLYNAVRGNKGMRFGEEAQSHSLSSETTFDFDLTDRYAIDTALMELSQTVMFRLHREKTHSRTLSLKIRYEDFTTVSVQETNERPYVSADDLYERSVKLFSKKYEPGRGIRLLGVCAQNVEDDSIPSQKELFDFVDEKKAKVEKAILALETKHPGVVIEKARTMHNTPPAVGHISGGKKGSKKTPLILLTAALLTFGTRQTLSAETATETSSSGAGSIVFSTNVPLLPSVSSDEAPVSLFNYTTDSNNIEFLAKGYWQSEIENTVSSTFGFGKATGLSFGSPVFSQKVDLTLWFFMNKSWYFESSFADGFKKNTVAAGYYGTGILKHARISNRGISFPTTYSASKTGRSIGGGENSAPGILFHFEGTSWKADGVVRYDMLTQKSKSFTGLNEVSTTKINCASYVTGRQFILPASEYVGAVTAVYVESNSGSYKDTNGRTYKKLPSSDYLLVPSKQMIVLSSSAGASKKNNVLPSVAVTFATEESFTSLKQSLGSYGTSDVPGDEKTFLGAVQRYFSSGTSEQPSLAHFSYNMFTTIDGSNALLIQYPSSFSPFAVASRYNGGSSADADALVVHTATETADISFTTVQSEDDTSLVSSDFFSDEVIWLTVQNNASTNTSYTDSSVRFPFATVNPSCYLGYTGTSDLALETRTYAPVTSFSIGTDAASGTVTLSINDTIDYGATYDSGTGIVTPSRVIADSDQVYITWSEDSGSTTGGTVAAALGYAHAFTPYLSADLSFTSRWTLSPSQSFADQSTPAPGFASFTTGVSYKKETLSLSNTLSLSLDNENTTGLYRILGMDDTSGEDVYLSASSGVLLPNGFAPVLTVGSTEIALDSDNDGSAETVTAKQDSSISGYKIPIAWDFTSLSSANGYAWSSVALDFGSTGASLAGASSFSIALQSLDRSLSGYHVYLQLGVSAEDDFTVEDSSTIPTWLISKDSVTDTNSSGVQYAFVPSLDAANQGNANGTKQLGSGWQQVTVTLTSEQKARLVTATDARIVITAPLENKEEASFPKAGVIYAGPWSYTGSSFGATYDSHSLSLSVSEETDSALATTLVSTLNASELNTVERATWRSTAASASDIPSGDDATFTLSRSFSAQSLSSYRYLSLYFKYEHDSALSSATLSSNDYALFFELNRPDATGTFTPSLQVSLSSSELESLSSSYHELTVDLYNKTVSVDGAVLSEATAALYVDPSVVPVHFAVTVNTLSEANGCMYTAGCFSFDELHLSESTYSLSAADIAEASWKKDGVLFQPGNVVLLKDVSVSAKGTGAAVRAASTSDASDRSLATSSLTGNASVSFTSLGVSFAFDAGGSYSTSSETDATLSSAAEDVTGLTTAGYTVATEKPLFGLLSINSTFRTSPVSATRAAGNKASLSFKKFHLPLVFEATSNSAQSLWTQTATATGNITFTTTPYALAIKASLSQKKKNSASDETLPESFVNAEQSSFTTGDFSALRRVISASVTNTFSIPFGKLKPSFVLSTEGVTATSLYTDTTETSFEFPFTVAKNTFAFSWSKKTSGIQGAAIGSDTTLFLGNGAYRSDMEKTAAILTARDWYWKALPFGDLFSPSLCESVLCSTTSSGSTTSATSDSCSYTGTYSATWKRPLSNSYTDIFIPSGANVSFARDISTASTIADTYQFKAGTSYSALNLFGTLGPYHTFSWYEQDSLLSSLNATLKIPHDDPTALSMVYSGYIETDFFLKQGGSLKTGLEGTFSDTENWTAKCTGVWKRSVASSPLVSFAYLLYPKFDMKKIKLTRTDSCNYALSETASSTTTDATVTLKHAVSLTHLLEAQITKYMTLNGSIAGTYSCTPDTIMSLGATVTLGGKVSF